MTRKDYVLLADAMLKAKSAVNNWGPESEQGVKYAALTLSDALSNDNPRFDRDRFLTACGF